MKQILATALVCAVTQMAFADGDHDHGAITSAADKSKVAPFDILSAKVERKGRIITFHMSTTALAGSAEPAVTGNFAGSSIWAYVWPTSLDPDVVGFEGGTGILALAATNHPDFDDTPLFDENLDGDTDNDGANWHSHWVVLVPNEACGAGALAVRDIPEGSSPRMPSTWPGVPMFLDSPGYTPVFDGPFISINVALANADASVVDGVAYDGVTSALRINTDLHAALACVTDVFDIASGDLSLPGKVQ